LIFIPIACVFGDAWKTSTIGVIVPDFIWRIILIFELTNISIILFITTGINAIATYISWHRRNSKGGLYFAWGMVGVTLWTLASALDYAAVPDGYSTVDENGHPNRNRSVLRSNERSIN
jgi:hypothetical protein